MKASVLAACLAGGCAGAAAAQSAQSVPSGPLRVYEMLPPRAVVELEAAWRGVEVRLRRIGVEVRAVTRRTPEPPGVLVGAPAAALAELERRGRLAAWPAGLGAGLEPSARRGSFALPWVAPIVIGYGARWRGEDAPGDWDHLVFDARYDGEVVVCEPWAMPSLWIAWIQRGVRRGGEEWAFAWLRALDARVRGYVSSPEAAAAHLKHSPRTVAPVFLGDVLAARAQGNRVGWTVPESGFLAEAIGVGVLAGTEVSAARAVLERLLAPDHLVAIARAAGWLPQVRDAGLEELPADLRGAAARVALVEPGGAEPAQWFSRWEGEVKGVGRRQATLEWLAEAVFAVAFFAFLVWAYRHLGRTEAGRGRA